MDQKKLSKLISKAIAIEAMEAKEAGALGYMARVFTQASLPYSRIKESYYTRQNGIMKFKVISDPEVGVPYGTYPRLLMSWITTEAVRTKNHILVLGSTLSEFMDELGLVPSGGRWGTIPNLKDQMLRLFSSSISCSYRDGIRDAGLGLKVVTSYDLWWSLKRPNQQSLWQSTIVLGKDFFEEIITRPVPIDLRVLKVIKQSPMKL
ncbi:MAG: pirin, partial [Gammaproteobacteria bacterium]|nr:pirin [Gammaproteobacteria bacterium]